MKAIVLAGGKGTRLQTVVCDVPKPMAPVAGKPFLEYIVLQLKYWGIKDIILSVGHKKETVKTFFSSGSDLGVKIAYVEEDIPLGTGGAIREAVQAVEDQDVLVMNGDTFFNVDIPAIVDCHRSKNAVATIALCQMKDVGRYGRVEIGGSGEILRFEEKRGGRGGYINAGLYILNKGIFPYLPPGASSFENAVLPRLVGKGLFGSVQSGYFIDIGIPEDYMGLCADHEKLLLE